MNISYIRSIAHQIPEGRIDNESIMKYFKMANNDWLTDKAFEGLNKKSQLIFGFLGIKTRAVYKDIEKENAVSLAVKCCQLAIERSGLSIDDIDCLILTGITNPFREPTFANIVSRQMGFNNIDFFDVNDTCSGALKSIEIANLYLQAGKYKNIVICSCEHSLEFAFSSPGILNKEIDFFKIDRIEDFQYKVATLLLGSGAGALVLSAEEGGCKFLKNAQFRDLETWDRSWITLLPYVNSPPTVFGKKLKGFWVESSSISEFLLKKIPEFVKKKLNEWDVKIEDIKHVTTPQLGYNITSGVLNQLDISLQLSLDTFKGHGNMGAANVLVNLSEANNKGKLKSGDKILCIGGGGGLSILIALLEW